MHTSSTQTLQSTSWGASIARIPQAIQTIPRIAIMILLIVPKLLRHVTVSTWRWACSNSSLPVDTKITKVAQEVLAVSESSSTEYQPVIANESRVRIDAIESTAGDGDEAVRQPSLPEPPPFSPNPPKIDTESQINNETKIITLLRTLAKNGYNYLAVHKKEIENLGAEIDHVPPLEFLTIAILNPEGINNLRLLKQAFFKWPFFLSSMHKRFTHQPITEIALADFAAKTKLSIESLKPIVTSQKNDKWDRFINFVVEHAVTEQEMPPPIPSRDKKPKRSSFP